jgi:hypothetical protein
VRTHDRRAARGIEREARVEDVPDARTLRCVDRGRVHAHALIVRDARVRHQQDAFRARERGVERGGVAVVAAHDLHAGRVDVRRDLARVGRGDPERPRGHEREERLEDLRAETAGRAGDDKTNVPWEDPLAIRGLRNTQLVKCICAGGMSAHFLRSWTKAALNCPNAA